MGRGCVLLNVETKTERENGIIDIEGTWRAGEHRRGSFEHKKRREESKQRMVEVSKREAERM